MTWRDSIPSPQGYRYFLIVFGSIEELTNFSLPSWFDTLTMGYIALYSDYIVAIDGPDTTEDWVPEIGYPVIEIPTIVSHLKITFPYRGTITHLAFVRFSPLDREKDGEEMYAWSIATENWNTVYTNTLSCTPATQLWVYDESMGGWETSSATIDEDVWTELVSVVVENDADQVSGSSIEVTTSQGTYTNTESSFVGCLAESIDDVRFVLDATALNWKWEDTQGSVNPRTETATKWGLYLHVVNE